MKPSKVDLQLVNRLHGALSEKIKLLSVEFAVNCGEEFKRNLGIAIYGSIMATIHKLMKTGDLILVKRSKAEPKGAEAMELTMFQRKVDELLENARGIGRGQMIDRINPILAQAVKERWQTKELVDRLLDLFLEVCRNEVAKNGQP